LARAGEQEQEDAEADPSDIDAEIPHLQLTPQDVRSLLHKGLAEGAASEASEVEKEPAAKRARPRRAVQQADRKRQYEVTMRRGAELWETPAPMEPISARADTGPMHGQAAQAHKAARRHRQDSDEEEIRPFAGRTAARATLYQHNASRSIDAWLAKVQREEEAPNEEQLAFLNALADRLKTEIAEELQDSKGTSKQEPMLDLVHGLPGAGKKCAVKWARRLFEEALGWTHGVQFVLLSFLNSMAAHLEGFTIHHWSGIPVMAEDGTVGTKSTTTLSTKCQCLRFILLDEISMVSAELLGTLEAVVRRVVRVRSGYKRRAADGEDRVFGGAYDVLVQPN